MRTIALKGNEKLEILIQEILSSDREELIVAFGKTTEIDNGLIFLVKEASFADEAYISRSFAGLKWDAKLTALWVEKAEADKQGIVLIHAHGGRGSVNFSSTDSKTKERMLKHFNMYLQDNASGYVVVSSDDLMGEFIYKGESLALDVISSVSCPIVIREKLPHARFVSSPNHHRQEMALGERANQILRNISVAVVGLGGAGSMVAEQLAHLKVGRIVLVDGDILENSNLSRVVGSTTVDIGANKTDISCRLIKNIDTSIEVLKIKDYAPTIEIYRELNKVAVIISCVDKVSAKAALNTFSKRYIVPLIDVGVTIRRMGDTIENINGQVVRVNPSSRCLKCFGIISSALENQQSIENYGARVKNPQVITYNGVLASLAVGEMLKIITGVAGVDYETARLDYNGLTGEITRVQTPEYVCDICKSQYAQGDIFYSFQ